MMRNYDIWARERELGNLGRDQRSDMLTHLEIRKEELEDLIQRETSEFNELIQGNLFKAGSFNKAFEMAHFSSFILKSSQELKELDDKIYALKH